MTSKSWRSHTKTVLSIAYMINLSNRHIINKKRRECNYAFVAPDAVVSHSVTMTVSLGSIGAKSAAMLFGRRLQDLVEKLCRNGLIEKLMN